MSAKYMPTATYPSRTLTIPSRWQSLDPMPKLAHVVSFGLRPDGSPYASTKSERVAAYAYRPF